MLNLPADADLVFQYEISGAEAQQDQAVTKRGKSFGCQGWCCINTTRLVQSVLTLAQRLGQVSSHLHYDLSDSSRRPDQVDKWFGQRNFCPNYRNMIDLLPVLLYNNTITTLQG